jgi:CcmD family protein
MPVEEVPESEQIPAINLVAAAYGFVWVAAVGYTLSLATRLKKVERDLGELEKRGR